MATLLTRLRLGPIVDDVEQPSLVIKARRWIMVISLLLAIFGTIMVFSASTVLSYRNHNIAYNYGLNHVLSVAVGLVVMFFAMRISQRKWKQLALWLLSATTLVLLATFVLGSAVGGQQNWIAVGGIKLQPSEFAKISLVLCIAIAAGMINADAPDWKRFWRQVCLISGLLIGPVVLAGDAGTPAVMVPLALGLVIICGASWRSISYAGAVLFVGGVAIVMRKAYRLERLGSNWFDPSADSSGGGYQSTHGQYAIAGGGWFGTGLGSGREKWGGLPAAHTDFILASTAEETGVITAALVIAALGLLAFWFLRIALLHQELMPRAVCAGVGIWLGWQSIVNIAMVVGVFPVIGVTLPLVSYGGSSMIATLAGIGMGLSFLKVER